MGVVAIIIAIVIVWRIVKKQQEKERWEQMQADRRSEEWRREQAVIQQRNEEKRMRELQEEERKRRQKEAEEREYQRQKEEEERVKVNVRSYLAAGKVDECDKYIKSMTGNLVRCGLAAYGAYIDDLKQEIDTQLNSGDCGDLIYAAKNNIVQLANMVADSERNQWKTNRDKAEKLTGDLGIRDRSLMLDESVYGVANNDYLEAVRSMNAVDTVYNVTKLGAWYNAARGIQYLDVDIPLLNQYLWFLAISEPYDSVSYKTIAGMYDHYTMSHGQECLDVLLTKLYISCVLKETVDLPDLSEWIKRQKLAGKSKNIYLLASGLRWIGDRERERFVLEALQADRGTYAQLAEEHLREL